MRLKFTIVTLCVVLIFNYCNSDKKDGESTPEGVSPSPTNAGLVFDKLVGTWKSEDGKSFERWTKISTDRFQSEAFSVKGTDTTWNEQANVYADNEKWVFENTVRGQNQGNAVKFTSLSVSSSGVHFSNPAHDFPTDIVYNLPDNNTVNAYIVGPNREGGKDTIPFNYTRHQ